MPTPDEQDQDDRQGMDLIADFADHLAELRRADSTITSYIGILRNADADLPEGLACATEPELRAWLRNPAWTKGTAQLRVVVIRRFFQFACDPRRSPRLDFNPAGYLESIRVPRRHARPGSTSALTDLLRRARPKPRLCFLLASHEGARCIEIAALNREDIDEDETLLHGKGDKSRLVPTHPLVWTAVREMPPGPLLRGADGMRMSRRSVMRMANREMARLGYPSITMHMWRHYFGTKANDAIGDLAVVQDLLGHASPATTRIYVQSARAKMVAAVVGLPVIATE